MIRFRIGQSWKRERAARPVDAFGLDLDGVDLLAGASEEPLDRVVGDLLAALVALSVDGQRFAELALPEAHLEVVLRRIDGETELHVVSLARPAKRLRGPVRVDTLELTEAAVRCAQSLLRDVSESAAELSAQTRRALSRNLQKLERGPHRVTREERPGPPFAHREQQKTALPFAFELDDRDGLLSAYDGAGTGPLATLLAAGSLSLQAEGKPLWSHKGVPFLAALELSRQAADLLHAIELEERAFSFAPAGGDVRFEVDLQRRTLAVRGATVAIEPTELARGMFLLGQQLALAITTHNRAQARNPWLTELVERSREGLSRLGTQIQPPEEGREARSTRPRAQREKPLSTTGRVRRLRFDERWTKQNVTGEERGRILLGRRGPVVSSAELALAFSAKGELLFRHVATHGVAVSADGYVITATADRVLGFPPGATEARWLRDHDGLPIGPDLLRKDGLCVVSSQGRNALGFSELTGREVWRLAPPRTQRGHLSVQGHRALLATDSGYLYGLDLLDGQVRFRMRAAMPFTAPALPWGRKLLAVVGRGEKTVLFAADAHTGNVVWTQELPVGAVSRPVIVGSRVLLAGEQEREGVLICLGARGKPVWERRLHLGTAPFSVHAVGRSVLVTGQNGAAALFSLDGVPEWRVGSAGEELPTRIPPSHARGVIVVPGEVTRAIDPRGGRVLAEVRTGIALVDLKVDSRLNLYALDEDGNLTAYRLTTSLAVV